jgi:uncharacterized protein
VYLHRFLQLDGLLAKKSIFLLGPRSTGKTSLIKHQLDPELLYVNLLRGDVFMRLNNRPWELEEIVAARTSQSNVVIIDEIQRIPELLNEVHRLIEEQKIKFLLTGSSARKLKKQGVNLLAGRAWRAELFPLTSIEILDFDLNKYLKYGGLPQVYLSESPEEELAAYVDTYLNEEIKAESLVRNLSCFTRFLETAALTSGTMLNFNSLSNDVGVPASTVREYYQILEDTLIGFTLPAWTKTTKRKAISTAKFFLFDVGVRNQLAQIRHLEPRSELYGNAFEHFIGCELRAFLSYHRNNSTLCYWQAKNGQEVDFIIGDEVAIEIKTAAQAQDKHLKGLLALKEEMICKKYYLVSFDRVHRRIQDIEILHWQDFLQLLWDGKII